MIKKLENGLILELNSEDFTAKVINSPNAEGDIIIPRSINHQSQEYIITSIGEFSFENNEDIDSISFPDDSEIQTIEENAFINSYLTTILLPSSIKCLKKGWCNCTSNLSRILMSPNNEHFKLINNFMIVGKSDEKSNDFDILHFATRKITRIVVPFFIKYISKSALSECFNLREVIFEENSQLISIDDCAFSYTPIESVLFPKALKIIGDCSFIECFNLEKIEFSEDSELISIGNKSFSVCPVKKFVIPRHVTQIGDNVFEQCNELKEIIFEKNSELNLIKDCSFIGLSIEKICLPKSVTQIGKKAFEGCINLISIDFEKESQLRSIDKKAFSRTSINKIYISDKVDDLKEGWCCNVYNLTQISISPQNKRYSLYNNSMVISKNDINDENYNVLNFVCRNVDQIVIPSFIKRVDSYSCEYCRSLKNKEIEFAENSELTSFGKFSFSNSTIESITIPKNVIQIEEFAFSYCDNLLNIRFLEGLNYITIDSNAFFNSLIQKIYFSSNVDELRKNWCSKTPNLTSIEVSSENNRFIYIDDSMLIGKKDRKNSEFDILYFVRRDICNIVIPSYIKCIGSSAFSDTNKLISIKFNDDSELNIIEDSAFSRSSVESILIPKNVTKIDDFSFSECKMLKEIIFQKGSNLVSIGDYTFQESSIEHILIPENVQEIGIGAFKKCKYLCNVEFEENSKLKVIGDYAFAESNIKCIIVPKNINQIGDNTFLLCNNLKSIEFLSNEFYFNNYSFSECSNLFVISFPNSQIVSINQNDFLCLNKNIFLFMVSNSDLIFL